MNDQEHNHNMMNHPDISVIIPVYNTAQYLPECIESVRGQTMRNLEIILIDDGSTDASGIICDQYAAKDDRIRVFHTENQGHYLARGLAVEKAREAGSKYIGFVDSDDWIEPGMYEEMLKSARSADADVVECGYSMDFPDQSWQWLPEEGTFGRAEALYRLFRTDSGHDYFWNKLWKAQCFENFDFPDARAYMDACITYRIYAGQKTFVNLAKPLYHYQQITGSIVHSHDIRLLNQWRVNKDKYDFIENRMKEMLPAEQWTEIREKQLYKCVYAIGRNWTWWDGHSSKEKQENKHVLKEMSAFLKTHTALFGNPSWPVSLRSTAFLGRYPNRLSTKMAGAMNKRAQKRNRLVFFKPAATK
ncbi:glycosyltransferase family 2 protein [Aristaeella lactis]|nr:glycosyltransferase family 2 protein [Aristaeella lactis]QUA54395.1 glycosyltransferase family 2 protein [Aristaeella lactis]